VSDYLRALALESGRPLDMVGMAVGVNQVLYRGGGILADYPHQYIADFFRKPAVYYDNALSGNYKTNCAEDVVNGIIVRGDLGGGWFAHILGKRS
jgi:hypothetical protein